jgi:pyridoxine 5-phosphate synthase
LSNNHIRLGVNIDHVATIRNARGGNLPELSRAAKIVESSGADLLTVHLREDRRHVNEIDLETILNTINIPLNLEIAANPEMVLIAKKYKPHSVCFVPENRQELTTEGGLDVCLNFNYLKKIISPLLQSEINVALFIDPNIEQLIATHKLGIKTVEFHTGAYANAFLNKDKVELELKKIRESVKYAKEHNINSHAGHGLNYENVSLIASIPNIRELNIGHFLIGEAIFEGLKKSILKMRHVIKEAP